MVNIIPWLFACHITSPALVANLWDVTDKDIDRFSKALFHHWGLEPEDIDADSDPSNVRDVSLVEAVTLSRDECHLKYLIGEYIVLV